MEKIIIDKIINNLNTVFIAKKIIYFEKINSTNDHTLDLIEKGIDTDGMLVIAEVQDKGRGRFGKKWFSPQGGLWFSAVITSKKPLKILQNITLISALSIAEAIKSEYHIPINIKWPNDIYFQDKKIAGILIESKKIKNSTCLIIGIGINVNCSIEKMVPGNIGATSLSSITGRNIDREMLLCNILNRLDEYYCRLVEGSSFKEIFKELESYLIL